LVGAVGWRGTYLVYAALLALAAAPLHAFLLPRSRAEPEAPRDPSVAPPPAATTSPARPAPPAGWTFVLVATAFAAYAFVPSGLAAHLLAIFQRLGIEPATAVAIGAVFGPSQVAARVIEFVFARRAHPLVIARFAVSVLIFAFALMAVLGLSPPVAAL